VRNQRLRKFNQSTRFLLAIQDRAYSQTTELIWCKISADVDEPIWDDTWNTVLRPLWVHFWSWMGDPDV